MIEMFHKIILNNTKYRQFSTLIIVNIHVIVKPDQHCRVLLYFISMATVAKYGFCHSGRRQMYLEVMLII